MIVWTFDCKHNSKKNYLKASSNTLYFLKKGARYFLFLDFLILPLVKYHEIKKCHSYLVTSELDVPDIGLFLGVSDGLTPLLFDAQQPIPDLLVSVCLSHCNCCPLLHLLLVLNCCFGRDEF